MNIKAMSWDVHSIIESLQSRQGQIYKVRATIWVAEEDIHVLGPLVAEFRGWLVLVSALTRVRELASRDQLPLMFRIL